LFVELQDFKERFEKGEGDIQVQKHEIDIHAGDLSGLKSAFEKGEDDLEMTSEERAELKKKQIEEEFLRYKLDRRAAAKGDYSSRNEHEDKLLDVENKMAGGHHAEGAQTGALENRDKHLNERSKKEGAISESANRRSIEGEGLSAIEKSCKQLFSLF
uniref:DUF2852 domain-containing protein n=1 Tax=Onchocerca flexuosa TaxID=387005 RepID=A0A183HNH0_9BILA